MGKIAAMTGNTAAYTGAALCRPDLIAAYPITPQSSVVEGLAGMVYNGKLDSNFVQVESEDASSPPPAPRVSPSCTSPTSACPPSASPWSWPSPRAR